jgi:hypothetical protein
MKLMYTTTPGTLKAVKVGDIVAKGCPEIAPRMFKVVGWTRPQKYDRIGRVRVVPADAQSPEDEVFPGVFNMAFV